MSVVGRLWRRAPAWRLWLFVAVASTALAAMFPPRLPAWLLHWRPGTSGPRYAPHDGAKPAPVAEISLPPLTDARQTMIPFAGRQIPLPQGKWTELALLSATGPVSQQGLVLARLQSGRMTGMIMVLGTPAIGRDARLQPDACIDPTGRPVHVVAPSKGDGQATQECWLVRKIATSNLIHAPNPLESHAFARLGALDVAVPTHLLVSLYFRHADDANLAVTIMLPDPSESAALMRRFEAWMRHWAPLLHRGFDAELTPAAVGKSLSRDPSFVPQ